MAARARRSPARAGFTLAEMVVVCGILGLTLAVGVAPFRSILTARTAGDAGRTYAYALRDAAQRARTMDSDSAWGVRVASSTITVFSGASYAARTTSLDKTFGISSSVAVAGPLEVVFAKFSGVPGTTGTTSFATGLATTSVGVNARGTVSVTP